MILSDCKNLFITEPRRKAVERLLQDRKVRRGLFTGLAGSSFPMLLEAVRCPGTAVVVCEDMTLAGYMYNDLLAAAGPGEACIFPSGYKRDIRYGQPDGPQQILRTETLDRLGSGTPPRWIVTYPEALAEKVADRKVLADNTVRLHTGDTIKISDLQKRLLELGFNKVDYVYEPGQFAVRGSIVDIFSFSHDMPYRIDFFDDEIDTMRFFNVETQLSEDKIEEAAVMGRNASDAPGGVSLLDSMPDGTVLFCADPDYVAERVAAIASGHFSESAAIAKEGDADAMQKVVDPDVFRKRLRDLRIVRYTPNKETPSRNEQADAVVAFDTDPQVLYHKNFNLIAESFTDFIGKGYRILVLCDSALQSNRLKDIFEDRGDSIVFTPVEPTVHEGFVDNDTKTCFFTDHQIFDRFHNYTLHSDKVRGGRVAMSLKELNQIEVGDYIVHIDHGIGRFGGLVRTDTNGRPQEVIKVFFQNNDLVLVSIHQLHKLSKYRGQDGVAPKVSKLGSGAWQRLKERTKSKVKDIARDLIRLYATRRQEKGHAFPPDNYMQQELEASFVYEDTPDQIKATAAVKADMESPRPMDRLVCGDVGFGKTEIAVRAAFKAACDNKQTALLVPTTVLAMQHYHTFSDRLKDFPVRVEFMSRAKKPAEVKKILAELKEGKIDILIGTHKIIGKQVQFKDLGLLVIDEEQKFGVAVKEKLKQLKTNVDTLTMSATPIPRTLQFSLMGARDLSNLNTPPANRQPINTTVTQLSDEMLKEAVGFELSRNGQVFFVTNRIENLFEIQGRLERLLPGVRVVIAHGQMPPERMEQAIVDFQNMDYDVLLSTTIIENGVDMPNVNTILVNNAHKFGLSELHQLRGRVGRSSRKAFCYLLVPPGAALTPVARRRLQAIESFSDLGSGIHIAMQDLDIRGAGNLLGSEQSGFIADLGYEAYQQILRESVKELKTEEFADEFADVTDATLPDGEYVTDVTIDSDLELRLPPEYVPQENERISLYRQLDNMERPEQVEQFRAELRDRFGQIPQVSEELIKVVPLRFAAKKLGIERVVLKNGQMRAYLVSAENKAYYQSRAFGRVLEWVQSNPKGTHFKTVGDRNLIVIDNVATVSAALAIAETMTAATPVA